MVTDSKLKRLLEYDGLREAEAATGKSYKDDPETETLGIKNMLLNNMFKKAALEAAGDTIFGGTFDSFVKIAIEEGFQRVHQVLFRDHEEEDVNQWYWHSQDHLLLRLESYQGTTNSAKLYFEWVFQREGEQENTWEPEGCSRSPLNDPSSLVQRCSCSKDVREGFRYFLRKLREPGRLTSWSATPYKGAFLHREDYKAGPGELLSPERNEWQEGLVRERLAHFPPHIQDQVDPEGSWH